jgi:hypothetical protein
MFGGLPGTSRKHFEKQAVKFGTPLAPKPPTKAQIRLEQLRVEEVARRVAEREEAARVAQAARSTLATVQSAHERAREQARNRIGIDEATIQRAVDAGLNYVNAHFRAQRMGIEAPPAPTEALSMVQRFNSELVAAQAQIEAQDRANSVIAFEVESRDRAWAASSMSYNSDPYYDDFDDGF